MLRLRRKPAFAVLGLVVGALIFDVVREGVTGLDLVLALALILGPWVLGAIVGPQLGRTLLGALAAGVLGAMAVALTLVAFLLLGGSSQEGACGEDACHRILGHWMADDLLTQWSVYAGLSWAVAAFLSRRARVTGQRANVSV